MCIIVHATSLITFYQQNALRTIDIEDIFVKEIIQHLNDCWVKLLINIFHMNSRLSIKITCGLKTSLLSI